MPQYRVSYLFSQRAGRIAGWSENFYSDGGTLALTVGKARALINILMTLHGRQTSLDAIRVSEIGGVRRSTLVELNSLGTNIHTTSGNDSDYPTTAALIQLKDDAGNTTRQWLKGVPDNLTHKGGVADPANGWFGAFEAFAGVISSNEINFCLRIQSRVPAPLPIDALAPLVGSFQVPGHNYIPGNRVRVSGIRGTDARYANRIWRVASVTATTFTVIGWAPPVTLIADVTNATSRLIVYVYPDIQAVEFLRISKRNVGRPFAVLIGSRRS